MKIGRLMIITDTAVQDRFSHEALAERVIEGGADVVQFRDKRADGETLYRTAGALVDICSRANVPLIVNDRADVALALGVGVHLGRTDLPIAAARRLLGRDALIGGSAGTVEQAIQAQADGADYIGFGHIFPTFSKHKPAPAVGLDVLAEACRAVRVPVIAIGGINLETAASVLDAGAWGFAAIGAVCGADDPRAAAAEMRTIIDRQVRESEGAK